MTMSVWAAAALLMGCDASAPAVEPEPPRTRASAALAPQATAPEVAPQHAASQRVVLTEPDGDRVDDAVGAASMEMGRALARARAPRTRARAELVAALEAMDARLTRVRVMALRGRVVVDTLGMERLEEMHERVHELHGSLGLKKDTEIVVLDREIGKLARGIDRALEEHAVDGQGW